MAIREHDSKGRTIFRDIIDPNSALIRQTLIKQIEQEIGAALITYTANLGAPGSGIMIRRCRLIRRYS